ncbi:unnamed protein product, partial [marine sediment metagenome]
DEIAVYLRTQGYVGNNNDVIMAWLETILSTEGQMQDLWFQYLKTEYPTAETFNDAYKLWKDA